MEESFELLRRQYLQLLPLEQMTLPSGEQLKDAHFQTRLYQELFSPDAFLQGPPDRYKLRLLKTIVREIEASITDPDEDEISDDLLSCLTTLVTSSLPSEIISVQQKCYVHYTLPVSLSASGKPSSVTLLESRGVISASGTTGFRTWDAALRLGTFLASPQGRKLVNGEYVLELGAGTGFLSVLCAKYLRARHVLATDGDSRVIEDLKENAMVNGLEDNERFEARALKWGHDLSGIFSKDEGWSDQPIVIAADVTYDRGSIPSLLSTMRELFERCHNVNILLAATIRNQDTFDAFLSGSSANSFEVDDLSIDPCIMNNQTGFFHPIHTPIRILRISRSRPSEDPFAI